jgi:hypothetical protein
MDNQGEFEQDRNVIRISRGDAMSNHVDDLLKRQMSLRGDTNITQGKRRWYYQNWFIFMIVAAVGAIAAWGLLEPYFDDCLYIQGPLEEMNAEEGMGDHIVLGRRNINLKIAGTGVIKVRGEKIWIQEDEGKKSNFRGGTKMWFNGKKAPFDWARLKLGEETGVYVDYVESDNDSLAIARFVVPTPSEHPPAKAALPLAHQHARKTAAGLLLFPLVAGLIGLAIGAADGVVCRLARRAILGGSVGLLVGLIGGFICAFVAGIIYTPLTTWAVKDTGDVGGLSPFGFVVQLTGRALAWCVAGMAMGLGQGIALRSKRLLLYGFIGGTIGGLLGGLLFDPIDLILLGMDKPSAHWSRLIGFTVIGAGVGCMIGIVERLARDVWLRMIEGPLAGKEFLIFKDIMNIGSSPRSAIYLFNDPNVASHHATLRAIGEQCEIENHSNEHPLLVNAIR